MNFPIDSDIDEEVTEELIERIEQIVNETNLFNKSNVEMVNIYFFYCVNESLEQYTKIVLPLKVGLLTKGELHRNVLKYRNHDGRRYILNSIHSYQFDSDIVEFLNNNECDVKEHTKIEEIVFEPMVELFQHYSSIFVIYNNEKTKHTKKLYEAVPKSKRKTIKV